MKFKGTILTKRGVVARLLHYHRTSGDKNKENGMIWYAEARSFCEQLSIQSGLHIVSVAGIVAALSPMKVWDVNKKAAIDFILHKKDGVHFKAQVNKAKECLHTSDPLEIFSILTKDGRKTSWFFWNILYPTETSGVTIDRHAIGSCVFSPREIRTLPDNYNKMTVGQYNFFVDAYKHAAGLLGIMPHQLQAIIWDYYRELKQLEEYVETPF